MGAILVPEMTAIRHRIATKSPINDVFKALTSAPGLRGWWSRDCDIGEGVGAEHVLRFVKEDRRVTMRFRVEALEPGARVRWRCIDNDNPVWVGTTLEWRVQPSDEGSTLVFEHRDFTQAEGPAYAMTVEGWTHFCNSLQRYLDTGTGEPW